MNEKYFPELARRLRQQNIETGQPTRSSLPVLVDGQEVMWIEPSGSIVLKAGALDDPLVDQVYETAIRTSAQVYEYIEAMASAPRLEAVGLSEDFRLLAEFNGVVLAGQELERDWGYKFVTWRRDGNGTGVAHGNYYHNDYDGAKLDFACRTKGSPRKRPSAFVGRGGARERTQFSPQAETKVSGLCPDEVQECRQFSDEQLTEIYRCIYETMDSEYPISEERRAVLSAAAEQIERSVDDLDERVGLSNQRELEAAEQREDSGPRWEMSP